MSSARNNKGLNTTLLLYQDSNLEKNSMFETIFPSLDESTIKFASRWWTVLENLLVYFVPAWQFDLENGAINLYNLAVGTTRRPN